MLNVALDYFLPDVLIYPKRTGFPNIVRNHGFPLFAIVGNFGADLIWYWWNTIVRLPCRIFFCNWWLWVWNDCTAAFYGFFSELNNTDACYLLAYIFKEVPVGTAISLMSILVILSPAPTFKIPVVVTLLAEYELLYELHIIS